MGCVSSKVDNEEIVSRCKQRRKLMKQAVNSRHHFAAAHSAYLTALRNTGMALRQFAEGETMVMSSNMIEAATPSSSSSYLHYLKFPPPPPPPPPLETSPSGSPSVLSSRLSSRLIPHILSSSENSHAGSPPPPIRPKDRTGDDYWASSQYSNTIPSYQGSMWNGWEPFCPSSPSPRIYHHEHQKVKQEEVDQMPEDQIPNGSDDTSSTTDVDEEQEHGHGPDFQREVENSIRAAGKVPEPETDDISSVTSWYTKDTDLQMTITRKHKDFGEIVRDLDEYFLKASAAGKEVSRLLETSKAHNDIETRKNVYHSANVFHALSWTWTSKPPLAIRYTLEPNNFDESGTRGSHCSTLERLLAWEKKLYEEVRSEEATKIEQEKKLAQLQNQEVKGEDGIKVDKTRASIKRLQSLITVASQAVKTTSTEIVKLRENELCPQLAELSEGLMHMWRTMNECHQIQNHIVQQVKHLQTLVSGEATSDNHRQATIQLEVEVTAWHSSFCSLIKSQREYICALHEWVRLSLRQLGNEAVREHGKCPPIYTLCEEWKLALERLPHKVASEAIKSFVAVIRAIVLQQGEEQKHKRKTESLSKEVQKKMISLNNIEKKYYSSYSLPARTGAAPDAGYEFDPRDPLAEKRAEIDSYKRRIEDEKSNCTKSAKVTREMTLNSIQTGLPGVFQVMSGFSSVCMHAFEAVYNQTKSFDDHSSVRMLK
eukprot:Gb_15914 [translate_table: standard]